MLPQKTALTYYAACKFWLAALLLLSTKIGANDCYYSAIHQLPKKIPATQFCMQQGIDIRNVDSTRGIITDWRKGDRVSYQIEVEQTQDYEITLSYFSKKGAQIDLVFSPNLRMPVSFAKTTESTNTVNIKISLPKGAHQMTIQVKSGRFDLAWFSFLRVIAPTSGPLADGQYALINEHSRKSLDVQDRVRAANANIQQWEYYAADNQRWSVKEIANNRYQIMSIFSGLCLAVNENLSVVQQGCEFSEEQMWAFELIVGNIFLIKNLANSTVLSVLEQGKYDGANIIVAPFTQDKAQLWRVNPLR